MANAASGGVILDRDIQLLVNDLWAAGAEAIAIGGVRLQPSSAIRQAGGSILVDNRPVFWPMTIEAIGDPSGMQVKLIGSAGYGRFSTFAQLYGIEFDVSAQETLNLPGGIRRGPAVRESPGHRPDAPPSPPSRTPTPTSDSHRPNDRRTLASSTAVERERRSTRRSSVYALLALVAGVAIGLFVHPTVPDWLGPYLPIAVVAALDAVFGGLRAKLDDIFDAKVFVISFVANVLVAAFIVFLGDQLGVGAQLSTAVVVVLGIRIFGNAAAIRRHIFKA